MNTAAPAVAASSPLISVVIATYNYGHLIERAIASVLAQSFKGFEIIVIDDGSTDNTADVVKKYGAQLRYAAQENRGQSTAYNHGASMATAPFILILDADDELLPDCLEHFHKAIQDMGANREHCIYYGGYISVSSTGEEEFKPAALTPTAAPARLEKFLERKITGLQHGSTLTPRHIFEKVRYPEGLRNNTDIVFFGQVLANYPAHRIEEYLCRIHAHPQRVRQQLDKILKTGMTPVDALFDPSVIPASLMPLKRLYRARRHRSIARLLYINKRYPEARHHYFMALKAQPSSLMELSSLSKAIRALFKSLLPQKC